MHFSEKVQFQHIYEKPKSFPVDNSRIANKIAVQIK